MKLRDDYIKLHENNAFSGMTIARFADPITKILRQYGCKSVLDYGCAKGQAYETNEALMKMRKDECMVTLYDPGVPEYAAKPATPFDAVVCVDVVEHVPEDELDAVLKELFHYAEKVVIATFCPRGSKKKLPSTGQDVHITQHNRLWWEERFHLINAARTRPIPWFLFENP
jgi:2-polyprenyl-3-methyl-5-hydroxy-6-metoxy-1,4-benzoquinol methylase